MKKWIVPIICFLYLVGVNTSYFWGGNFLYFIIAFWLFILLILLLLFLVERYPSTKINDNRGKMNILILTLTIAFIFVFPFGIIPYKMILYGKPIFMVRREGAANCNTWLELYSDDKFVYEIN